MKNLLLATLCIAGVNLCLIDTAAANKDRIKLTGTVTDATMGKSLQGVSVSVNSFGNTTYTDKRGKFAIPNATQNEWSNNPRGKTAFNATAYGFFDYNKYIPIASNKDSKTTVKMKPLPAKHPRLTGDWELTLQCRIPP